MLKRLVQGMALAVALCALLGTLAYTADQTILGKRFLIKDPQIPPPLRHQYAKASPKDTVAWKWNKGDLTELVNFRDPVRGFNDYRMCIYDGSANSQPLMEAEVLPGENCGNAKCWKEAGTTGLKFKSKLGVPDGITTLTLKAGAAGKAKLLAKGKGANLGLPSLPLTGPVTVQFLVNDGRSRECWETTYTATSRNEPGKFDAKGP